MMIDGSKEIVFREWNEAMARKYDPEAYHLRSNLLIRWIERRRVKTIVRFLGAAEAGNVLEIGCGAGNVLEQARAQAMVGLDLSTFLLGKSRRRLARYRALLTQANAERLPFRDGQFQRQICSEVLEHVSNPDQVVSEMARVAAPDGIVVISVPNEAWIDRVKQIIRSLGLQRWLLQGNSGTYHSPDQMTDEWHLHHFDLNFLQEILAQVLVIRKVQAIPFAGLPLRFVVECRLPARANAAHGTVIEDAPP